MQCKDTAKSLLVRYHIENCLPLSHWDKEATRQLLHSFLHAFGVSASSYSMRQYMYEQYDTMKSAITKRLKKRMFSCQFDLATRKGREILGVSVQFLDPANNMESEVISIGMLPVHGMHSAENIKLYVEKCFSEFELSPVQVYGYTTDNGANVLKTTRELLTEQEESLIDSPQIDDEDAEEEDTGAIETTAIREDVRKLRVELKRDGLPQPPLSNITRYVVCFVLI